MMNRTSVSLFLSVVLLAGCTTKCIYPARSLDQSQLEGVWIGYAKGNVEFFRLALASNGSSSFATAYSTNSVAVYRLPRWTISGHKLDFTISNQASYAEPVSLTGETVGGHIKMFLKGSTWERTADLQREDELFEILRHVKGSVASIPTTQQPKAEK